MNHSGKHYDQVTGLFETILGENLHVGYFDSPNQSIADASLALTNKMAEHIDFSTARSVIDVGCGVGGPARFLANNYKVNVMGISNSEACIDRASEFLNQFVTYRCMDAMDLVDSSVGLFDVAWLLESSHLMPDKGRLFEGLASVTNKSGQFILCDFFLSDLDFAKDPANLLKMRKIYKVFGRLHLTPPQFYQKHAKQYGFDSEIVNITKETFPTLDIWLSEADNQSCADKAITEFVESVQYLKELYQNEIVSYYIIKGEKSD